MRFKKWNIGTPAERDVALLRSAGYPYLLSTVLAARGVTTAEAAAEALERDRSLSMSPMLMRDMDKAVARIQRAISQGETIAVFGDYDVDGITSTVLLMDYLKSCGVRCLRHIPRRIEEGYGLSKEAIQGLRDQGATLMITVDCGITGNEEVDFAASIGLDVVITDHHECKEELPRALAVVDPHRSDCPYPFKHLAGVGVALKLVLALGGESREDALFARYCTLAAIGTIADVMRMEGENRTIAFCGLEALPHTDFVGVHAPTYVDKYDTTADLKDGGTYLLNCPWSAEELEERLPAKMKRDLANKHANFYIMDATKLARDLGLGNRINTILQAAFFQLTKVMSRLTVLDNMLLGAPVQPGEGMFRALFPGMWRKQEQANIEKAEALLERFLLIKKKDDYAGALSGGQRKLLEMARALMSDPKLVMLDEPMAGVNPALKQSLLDHIMALREEGTTVLFVEHDINMVRHIADWVTVMAEGKIVAEGQPKSVMNDPAVIDAYLGAHANVDLGDDSVLEDLKEA